MRASDDISPYYIRAECMWAVSYHTERIDIIYRALDNSISIPVLSSLLQAIRDVDGQPYRIFVRNNELIIASFFEF